MSAFVVSKEHIDTLVGAERRFRRHLLGAHYQGDDLGRILWRENVRSVAYRYPADESGTRPGPASFTDEQADRYTYQPMPGLDEAPPGALLKAIRCYEYQSCEHPEWEASEAHQFCERLQYAIISTLPGWDDSETWDVSSRDAFRPKNRPRRLGGLA